MLRVSILVWVGLLWSGCSKTSRDEADQKIAASVSELESSSVKLWGDSNGPDFDKVRTIGAMIGKDAIAKANKELKGQIKTNGGDGVTPPQSLIYLLATARVLSDVQILQEPKEKKKLEAIASKLLRQSLEPPTPKVREDQERRFKGLLDICERYSSHQSSTRNYGNCGKRVIEQMEGTAILRQFSINLDVTDELIRIHRRPTSSLDPELAELYRNFNSLVDLNLELSGDKELYIRQDKAHRLIMSARESVARIDERYAAASAKPLQV